MASRLAELDSVPPGAAWDPDAVSTIAGVLAVDLIEPAHSRNFDEGRQALVIATASLRSKAPGPNQAGTDRPSSGSTL